MLRAFGTNKTLSLRTHGTKAAALEGSTELHGMKPPFEPLTGALSGGVRPIVIVVSFGMVFPKPFLPRSRSVAQAKLVSQSNCLESTSIESQSKSEQYEYRERGHIFCNFKGDGMRELSVRRLGQSAAQRHCVHSVVGTVEHRRAFHAEVKDESQSHYAENKICGKNAENG